MGLKVEARQSEGGTCPYCHDVLDGDDTVRTTIAVDSACTSSSSTVGFSRLCARLRSARFGL